MEVLLPQWDELELWASANKALEDFLSTKASIDACRQRAMWELGIALCQSESKAAESIKEAKAASYQVTLDAHATCSWLTLEAKTNCSQAILRIQDHLLNGGQESQDNQRPYGPRS